MLWVPWAGVSNTMLKSLRTKPGYIARLLHGRHGLADGLLGGVLQETDEDHQTSGDGEEVTVRQLELGTLRQQLLILTWALFLMGKLFKKLCAEYQQWCLVTCWRSNLTEVMVVIQPQLCLSVVNLYLSSREAAALQFGQQKTSEMRQKLDNVCLSVSGYYK